MATPHKYWSHRSGKKNTVATVYRPIAMNVTISG